MEAAIRWAPGSSPDVQRYLLVDVAGNSITLNEHRANSEGASETERIARYDKVPNFTAFDWSKTDRSLVALGLSSGDASLLQVDPDRGLIAPLKVFPIRTQRKANSISFNDQRLLAVALDRVRNDHCLTVYDVDGGKEPVNRLCTGEGCSSVRFFPSQPQEVIAAVARSSLRLYDLRDASSSINNTGPTVLTRQVNNIAIDPLDDNYIASGGSTGDPTVSIWDRRWIARSSSLTGDGSGSQSVLDIRPAIDNSMTASIWSIRYSGMKRGRFGVLSSTGALRLYDLTTHVAGNKSRVPIAANSHGGSPWSGPTYIQRTHELQYPFYDKLYGQEESARVTAFDWLMSDAGRQEILALRLTREVNVLSAPSPQSLQLTAFDELAVAQSDFTVMQPRPHTLSVADDVVAINRRLDSKIKPARLSLPGHQSRRSMDARPLNAQTLESLREPTVALQRTQSWLQAGPEQMVSPLIKTDNFSDALTLINVHRRRSQEGYRLDSARNRQIVKDDPTLDRLWAIVQRLESLAANGGMTSETMDLSYFGVQGLWAGNLGDSQNRMLPGRAFSTTGFETSLQYLVKIHGVRMLDDLPVKSVNKRLLCLEMCGWCFSREAIEGKCTNLLEGRQFYRAVTIAAFQGHQDLCINMLRNLIRRKNIPDTGVGALLASRNLNQEQKDMCGWMEEDATDPYLKALLRYIRERDWHGIAHDPSLLLSDRLSVALRYLSDTDMATFITRTTATCTSAGDLSGIMLTGLTSAAIPLLQSYLARTHDLQTAVLVASFTCPMYVDDARFDMWRETYLDLLQHWRHFMQRTRYTIEHGKRSTRRDGTKLLETPPRQISLRCVHCNGSLARPATETGSKLGMSFAHGSNSVGAAQRVKDTSGTACPKCGRHLPRCSVCLLWLGTPEAAGPRKGVVGEGKEKEGERDAAMSRFVTFCAGCGHGACAGHARLWFAKHGQCAVPDCTCLCGVRR